MAVIAKIINFFFIILFFNETKGTWITLAPNTKNAFSWQEIEDNQSESEKKWIILAVIA